ncbi:MAG: NAD(P)/FAD-dependent oxidoreductase [Dethiobacteria bacterium]|jgi:digeranylgeranylglycerophospholipid reductase
MKVAVVGGGPAGLTAAKTAADNGLEVTLFEHYRIGERINCGEGFFDILGLCGKPEAGVLFKVQQILLKVNKLHRIDSSKLNLWMIDRAGWQRCLAEEARTSGVKILEETPIKINDMELLRQDYDWVIDASGVSAISLKDGTGAGENRDRAALTIQCRLKGDFSNLKNSLKAVLEPHYQGYYWIFPKIASEEGLANVGIGFFNHPSAKINLRQELSRVLQQENLQDYPILECRGGKIPLNRATPFMKGNTLLVGDAAGLASPLYGGGLDMAVVSGRLAALSLAQGEPHKYEQLFWEKVKHKAINEEKIYNLWEQKGINFMEYLFKAPANFLIPVLFNLASV